MCNKNSIIRQSLFKVEQHNKELRGTVADLEAHVKLLQYIIKVQRAKLNEWESGRNL